MGRKLDVGKSSKRKLSRAEKDLNDSVNELLTITTLPLNTVTSQAFENHKKINALIEKIKLLEDKVNKRDSESTKNRESIEVKQNFMQWVQNNSGELNGCSIGEFQGFDLGIKADEDIPESSLIITVPRKLVLSAENARETILKDLMDRIEILGSMPNVLLAIHLLVEKYSANSFWKPYIDILPKVYTTVLYFTMEELEELRGSPTLDLALNQIRSIARQYAYFFKLFSKGDDPVSFLMKNRFSFKEYCWAVSTVMTRQNMIPSKDRSKMTNALIPLWDLCNHTSGNITTDYNPDLDRCECLALKDFKAGDQIFIFYGARTNSEFFIHNGFVDDNNKYDTYPLFLGISKSDPLKDKRKQLLGKLSLPQAADFAIKTGEQPVADELLTFLNVFNMNEEQLNLWLNNENITDLRVSSCKVEDSSVDKKCWTFLQTRFRLLLSSYKTSVEQDLEILRGGDISANKLVAVRMRLSEKRILQNALEYVTRFV